MSCTINFEMPPCMQHEVHAFTTLQHEYYTPSLIRHQHTITCIAKIFEFAHQGVHRLGDQPLRSKSINTNMVAVVTHNGARLSARDVVPLCGRDRTREGLVGLCECLSAFGHLPTVLGAKSEGLVPSICGGGDGAVEESGCHGLPGGRAAW